MALIPNVGNNRTIMRIKLKPWIKNQWNISRNRSKP